MCHVTNYVCFPFNLKDSLQFPVSQYYKPLCSILVIWTQICHSNWTSWMCIPAPEATHKFVVFNHSSAFGLNVPLQLFFFPPKLRATKKNDRETRLGQSLRLFYIKTKLSGSKHNFLTSAVTQTDRQTEEEDEWSQDWNKKQKAKQTRRREVKPNKDRVWFGGGELVRRWGHEYLNLIPWREHMNF